VHHVSFYYVGSVYLFFKLQNIPVYYLFKTLMTYRGADKSLARQYLYTQFLQANANLVGQ